MRILSHRGYWKEESEKNQEVAFQRSFDLGFGTETDVRDICGKLVIAHDCPLGNELTLEYLLQIMNGRNLPLAVNIKADGLAIRIKEIFTKYQHNNYFVFDMSIPDMVYQLKQNMPVYTGLSDILNPPVLLTQSEGVWLDCFYSDWYSADIIDELISQNKKVCIVSSDLHKREIANQWKIIKKCLSIYSDHLSICTDYPEKAQEYFNEH